MTLYTSDVDTIYRNIHNRIISADSVRILSSQRLQSLSLLKDFINIEEIYCGVVCHLDQLPDLADLISQRHKLSHVSFIIYIPPPEIESEENGSVSLTPPRKRRRLTKKLTPFDIVMKNDIPNLINKLGQRMRYINITITIADSDSKTTTLILLNKGIFCAVFNNGMMEENMDVSRENNKSEEIFQAIVNTGSLSGLVTKGDSDYNLSTLSYIPELTIITRIFNDNNPLNESYLKALILRSEVVTIIYEPDTVDDMYIYSDLIRQGSKGGLKRIKGIVPVSDVGEHIEKNRNLEEIHTLVQHRDDVDDMRHIIEIYEDRPITYYIYYHRTNDIDYWSCLKNTTIPSDIVFKDIIRSLMY